MFYKYKVMFEYIANYLTKIDGINLRKYIFRLLCNWNILQNILMVPGRNVE